MSTETPAADPTMHRIIAAVTAFRAGETDSARAELEQLWEQVGTAGDALHRCTLAHYLADMYDDPARGLIWDTRALDAADALTDERAKRHHASLQVRGFYPSLHLNLADNLRRLGSFSAAAEHLAKAKQALPTLAEDGYGELIRTAVAEVDRAIGERDTARREHAPG